MKMNDFTACSLAEAVRKRQVKASEVISGVLKNIKENDSRIEAFLKIEESASAKLAEDIDKEVKPSSLLAGVPVANKDNILVKGRISSCASRVLENFNSIYNAHVIDEILDQQGVIIGNTNMDEFAMGSSTENSHFKITKNPWDVSRVPGGSSGGSAAAVASGGVLLALGSDTGGSIRQPAAFCGVVGLKPTYGLVSRYGLVAFASSLDQIGPIAQNVEDAALLLTAIAGHDRRDSTSFAMKKGNYRSALTGDIKGLRIGIPKEYYLEGIQREVRGKIEESIRQMEKMGAVIVETSLPHTEYATATYYIIATAEASSNLARYDGVKYGFRDPSPGELFDMYMETRTKGFGPEVKRRILLGTFVLSSGYYDAYYRRAQKARTLITQDFSKAFEKTDILLTPTSPTTAFKIGEKTQNPLEMYLSDIFTISVNLAGLPAVSIPCGLDDQRLPIGLQLIGPAFSEGRILNAAYAFEKNVFSIDKKDRNIK
jgi:aspartyl-tRNA(Asn)/glutamyl-tRNA(Gln) amidotransferase subunit A